ncbi:MAG TPA: alkaline phosphatase family protein [Mycobacteriales bacterium]|nr:alkaline phosphatase family protein [Mycobacteriales bacterium]
MAVVDHVVVLVLENRSFDHMLGYLEHPSPAFDGLTDGSYTNPGWDGGPPIATSPTAKTVLPFGPDHGHDAVMEQLALTGSGAARHATNQGFVLSYERKGRGLSPPRFGGLLGPLLNLVVDGTATAATTGRGPLVMCCQPMSHVPVLSRLALEFAVCTRWFCSVPGETWPNRNFLHAATSDGETGNELRPYTNRTVFDLLDDHGVSWHVYHDDTPQVWAFPALWDTPERHANWYHLDDFVTHVATGELPAYSFLEPNHRPPVHTAEYAPLIGSASVSNSQHPENNLVSDAAYDGYGDELDNDFTRAEALVATVYEALRANPAVFDRTMLLITYDEHGGLYDHVAPPTDVPGPSGGPSLLRRLQRLLFHRQAAAFDFTMLGPRVPAVVVSPHIAAGTVDTEVHEHSSVPATLRALFTPDASPLTERDRWATPFHNLATLDRPRNDLPDLSAFAQPRLFPTQAGEAGAPPPVPAAGEPGQTAPSADGQMPDYYQAFVTLAEQVHDHLLSVGEPEAADPLPGARVDRATEITNRFSRAAHRHRQRR